MSPPIPLEVNISNMIHHCQLVPISQTVLKLDPLPLDLDWLKIKTEDTRKGDTEIDDGSVGNILFL